LAVYNNEFILGNVAHASVQKIIKTAKSLKICYLFNINRIHSKIVRGRTEKTHQQLAGRFASHGY